MSEDGSTRQPSSDYRSADRASSDREAGDIGRGMRLPFRFLWFLAYHLVLLWATVTAANKAGSNPSFGLVFLAFVIGVGLILQASARLPAFFHGISLFVLLPGLALLGPLSLTSVYEKVAMSGQEVTVLSSSSHQVSDIGTSATLGLHLGYSYTDVRVRLSDGSEHTGIIRPSDDLAAGARVRMDVDRLGLVRPQRNHVKAPAALTLALLAVALLAEVEMVSALIRPDGGSLIADTARRNADKPDRAGATEPAESGDQQ